MKIADVLPQVTILPLRRFADAWEVSVIRSDKRDVFEQAILGDVQRIGTNQTVSKKLQALERSLDYPPGTEVGLLTADDLKWLAERWRKENPDKRLPLEVLAHTGLLDRDVLEMRLKLFTSHAQSR